MEIGVLIIKMNDLYDESITDVFFSRHIDYSKYFNCHTCQKSGSYCSKHRIEVETNLRKREIRKILQMQDQQSIQFKHAIKGLLESYNI